MADCAQSRPCLELLWSDAVFGFDAEHLFSEPVKAEARCRYLATAALSLTTFESDLLGRLLLRLAASLPARLHVYMHPCCNIAAQHNEASRQQR